MNQNPEHFPDIEIYLKRPEASDVDAWLLSHFDINARSTRGNTETLELAWRGSELECVIVPKAVKGGYTSVWFKSANTPWSNDKECAIDAFKHLAVEVRCSRGSWEEGADESGWLRITETGESVVNWIA